MDLQLQEFDDYACPRRRPWIILAIVVVVLATIFGICRARRRGARDVVPPEQTVASAGDIPEQPSPRAEGGRPVGRAPLAGPVSTASIQEALALEQRGDLLGSRNAYRGVLRRHPKDRIGARARESLGRVNIALLLSPSPMPEKTEYAVCPGDIIERIARKFGTTQELIARSNRIDNPDLIKAGDHLRVFNGKFSMRIDLSEHKLVLYMNGEFCKQYLAGTGAYDKTPPGEFSVTYKELEPTWWRRDGEAIPYGDERNILGTRWMEIKDVADPKSDRRGLGIHGTADDSSIGKSVSAGCIRMFNSDVEELYTLVPIGTKVSIVE